MRENEKGQGRGGRGGEEWLLRRLLSLFFLDTSCILVPSSYCIVLEGERAKANVSGEPTQDGNDKQGRPTQEQEEAGRGRGDCY